MHLFDPPLKRELFQLLKEAAGREDDHPHQRPLTFVELVGLSQYLLSRLGDNWHLAVTAAAVGGKSHEEEGRSGSHLRDPAHAYVNEKRQLRDGSEPGHVLSPYPVAALSSLSMNEVTEGELEKLCRVGAKAV